MRFIGTVVRLQVQESSLKVGTKPRRYDPAPIRSVPALSLSPAGVVGLRRERGDHRRRAPPRPPGLQEPRRRERDLAWLHGPLPSPCESGSVSIFRRYCRGEHPDRGRSAVSAADLAGGVVIEGADGRRLELQSVIVAAPCVEFARYALKFPDERSAGRDGDGGAALSRRGDARLLRHLRRRAGRGRGRRSGVSQLTKRLSSCYDAKSASRSIATPGSDSGRTIPPR